MNLRWSNSSLSTLQMCGERFRRRYIERDFRPASPRMLRGTVVHRVASQAMLRKLKKEADVTVEEARDVAASEFDREWRGGVALTPEETALGAKAVQAQSKDFAVDLSGFHIETVAPAVHPIGVERRIVVKPKDSDIEIHGIIDLIDAQPDGEVIRDLKTSEKTPPANTADTSQQLSMYAMIRLAETGALPKALDLDYLIRTPVKAEKKHVALRTTRDREDVQALVNRINVAVETVKRGIFVPANPDAWFCSAAYCDFYSDCPYVRRTDRPKN